MKVYQEEDELYQELVTMATTFFQYLLQPFRDMREVATSCKLGILVCFLVFLSYYLLCIIILATYKVQSVFTLSSSLYLDFIYLHIYSYIYIHTHICNFYLFTNLFRDRILCSLSWSQIYIVAEASLELSTLLLPLPKCSSVVDLVPSVQGPALCLSTDKTTITNKSQASWHKSVGIAMQEVGQGLPGQQRVKTQFQNKKWGRV